MSRDVKIYISITIGVVGIAIIYALIARSFITPGNYGKYTTVESLRESEIWEADRNYESNFCGYEDLTAQDQINIFIEAWKEFDNAFIVKPTGNIKCQYGCIIQEFVIEEVIWGEDTVGETCYSYFVGGHIETQGSDVFLWTYGINLMQPEKEYLLVCNTTSMSNFSRKQHYYLEPGICYLALDNDNVAAVCNEQIPYKEVCDSEFFVETEKTAAAMTEFKRQMLQYFLPE